jgi:cell volume regulation protein A
VESGVNDPLAIFLTIVLVEIVLSGHRPVSEVILILMQEAVLGALFGYFGGRGVVTVLNRLELPQGLHAPFAATGAIVVFALAQALHGSGFFAVYIAGLVVGNSSIRAHNTVVTFLDAVTWLAQIAMFVLLGLLASPSRLLPTVPQALAVALALMLIARPVGVFACLAPFGFSLREKLFVSWVGLRGAVGIFTASIPLLVNLPHAHVYFDVGFVIVLVSLLVQGWTIALAARRLDIAFARSDPRPQRVELDLPGQLAQELVGYSVATNSPYLRRGLLPKWAKPTLVVRDEKVLTPEEAANARVGDYMYLLAPPEKAQALDRFFVDTPPLVRPDPQLLGDFFVSGEVTLAALAEIYDLQIAPEHAEKSLADYFAEERRRPIRQNDILLLGPIGLLAHRVENGRVTTVGLRLAEPDEDIAALPVATRFKRWMRNVRAALRG